MLKATSFISPTVCPLSLDPLRIIQSVPFTHHTRSKIVSFLVPLKSTTLLLPLRLALSFLPLSLHHSSATATHQANSSLIRLTFHSYTIKNMRQYLVHTAEVIPTSSGRSSYPPSALTRDRLAHVVHLRTYGFSPCSHTPLRHFSEIDFRYRKS